MEFNQMYNAVQDARKTEKEFKRQCSEVAKLIVGNLRNLDSWQGQETLKAFKKELTQFNAVTGEWKN